MRAHYLQHVPSEGLGSIELWLKVAGYEITYTRLFESAREIVLNCRDELIPSQYVQTEEQILSAKPENYQSIHQMMGSVLSFLQESNG